ncbi:cytochrome P450 76T24-like [Euphorbia lathyris]|uniref:cytochrome P450 76T24-like n=1 Tax=Euphorbia lathyris TaxID=212925 RepID=UPI0033143B26
MDYLSLLLVLFLTLAIFIHVFKSKILCKNSLSLPPGPTGFPIIGNILEMGINPHHSLANLSKKFGPLMSLKLGSITTIVISSPEFAKEALQKHDQALSSRTIPDAARPHDHHQCSIVWLPALDRWRSLRKVTATELFTSRKLEATQDLRQKKVQELLMFVGENCKTGQAIDIGQAAFTTFMNLISNTFFSIDLASYNSNVSLQFYDAIVGTMEQLGKPNLADYFPLFQIMDPQGIRRRTKLFSERLLETFDGIITERLQLKSSSTPIKEKHDLLDSLLNISREENNSELSLVDIKHMLLDLFIAGIDTTSKTLEWGMAELLRNPDKLSELKKELKEVEGEIQESDIHRLPYLQATVKEILRLHAPGPFLVPHKAESNVEIGGFTIPKNAQILVNVWAMGRDGSIWENPDRFEPERFLASKIDVKGRDFELIPFGAGRRICPGLPLAHRMLHLILASLVQSFDWKLANGIQPNELDMTESFGLSLSKARPLLAIPCL